MLKGRNLEVGSQLTIDCLCLYLGGKFQDVEVVEQVNVRSWHVYILSLMSQLKRSQDGESLKFGHRLSLLI